MRSAVGHNFLVKIATGVRQSLKSLCDHACERHGEEEVELDLAECQRSLRIEVVHRHVLASSPISKATKLPQGSVHGISRPPAGREVHFRRNSAGDAPISASSSARSPRQRQVSRLRCCISTCVDWRLSVWRLIAAPLFLATRRSVIGLLAGRHSGVTPCGDISRQHHVQPYSYETRSASACQGVTCRAK